MARLRNFNAEQWKTLEKKWNSWWKGEYPDPMVVLESVPEGSGTEFSSVYGHLTRFGREVPAERIIDSIDGAMSSLDYLGDAFPRWWPNFGAGMLAALLGSEAEYVGDNTWFHPAGYAEGFAATLAGPVAPYWEERLFSITRQAIERWGDGVVFGYPDIGGNLDIIASLFGSSELLMATMDSPDEVLRLTEEVTGQWLGLFRRFDELLREQGTRSWRSSWMPVMAPSSTYPLQCDFSIMIGNDMFDALAFPDLERCCAEIAFPFYHLDGPGSDRHLDSLLSLERLKGIQWIPGAGAPPPEEWISLLRRIREGGKLCQVYTDARGARKICDELGGAGFIFCIGGEKGLLPTVREAEACLELLSRGGHYHG